MINKIEILTSKNLRPGVTSWYGGLNLRDFNITREFINESHVVVFVSGGIIKILKERDGRFTLIRDNSQTLRNLNKNGTYKKLLGKQQTYLYELLEENQNLDLSQSRISLILDTLLQGWYKKEYSEELNTIRKTFVKSVTYGKMY